MRLYGDAEFKVWLTPLTTNEIPVDGVAVALHCANFAEGVEHKSAAETPLREFCGSEKYRHLLPQVFDMVTGTEVLFEGSLTEWVSILADEYLQGWAYSTLRSNSDPQYSENPINLEAILSCCGWGWDYLKEGTDEDDVLDYLDSCGFVVQTQKNINDAILSMEEEISSDTFDGSTIDAWQERYEALQSEVPDDNVGRQMQKLWFPLCDNVSKPLAECQILRKDGNFAMWACRSETHMYLICFATS